MTITRVLIPSDSFTGDNVSNSPFGAQIQPSRSNPTTVTATTGCHFNTPRLSLITVHCLGEGAIVTHLSVSLGDYQILDTPVSDGYTDFSIPGQPDSTAPEGAQFHEITVALQVNFPDASAGLTIKNIDITLTD